MRKQSMKRRASKKQSQEEQNPPLHCCDYMDYVLEDCRIPLEYIPIFREYIIPAAYSYQGRQIHFCGWCGSKLPSSLRHTYFELLELTQSPQENFARLAQMQQQLPEEFKSDAWWKNRGL